MKTSVKWMRGATIALLGSAALAASAQIRIGQTAGLTGPVAASVTETVQGARLAIDAVNARGGVQGQKIELISLDDKFDPKLAADNAAKLIDEHKVVALFLNRGTPHSEAILPLLAQHRLPLIAPSTGAMLLHKPVNPYVFNVRATYQREAEKLVEHYVSLGLPSVGLVRVNDSFGNDGVEGVMRAFDAAKKKPVFHVKYDRAKPDFAELVRETLARQPQALIFVGSQQHVAEGTKAIRAAGSRAQIATLSNNASGGFVKAMGEHARGTVVSQVFPSERNTAIGLVRDLTALAEAKGVKAVTPSMLEGYAAARVLVAALERAGKSPTPARIVDALNGMNRLDLGGMELAFSPADHTGLQFVDISIIDAGGVFRR